MNDVLDCRRELAGFGNIGFDDSAPSEGCAASAVSIPASAMEPNPMPQRVSIPRRPTAIGEVSGSGINGFIKSVHKDKFVGQQQSLSQLRPFTQPAGTWAVAKVVVRLPDAVNLSTDELRDPDL